MRVHLIYTLAVGDANHLQHFNGALFDVLFALAFAVMQSNDFIDLSTDAEHRVQAGHRLLEDHRNIVAAQVLHDRAGSFGNIIGFAITQVQADLALNDLALGALQQLHQRKTGNGFAAAGFAHNAHSFAHRNFKRNTVHAFYHAGIGKEIGVQVIKFNSVFRVLHLGQVLRFRHILALALFFVLVRNAAVFFGDTPRLLGGKVTVLLFSHRVCLLSSAFHLGVKGIAQAIAHKVEAQNRDQQADAGRDPDEQIVGHNISVVDIVDDVAPGCKRVLNAQT